MLSTTWGSHILKLVTPCGVVYHSERGHEPQSCCQHPWPMSAEAARTIPDCSPGRRKETSKCGDPWVNCVHEGIKVCFTLCFVIYLKVFSGQRGHSLKVSLSFSSFIVYKNAISWNFQVEVVGKQVSLRSFPPV